MTIRFDEKDVEDWLFDNPNEVSIFGHKVEKWIARQYKVPSGVIDLIGYMGDAGNNPIFVIVEVKNVRVDSSALAQVSRYEGDIRAALGDLPSKIEEWYEPNIYKIIVAPGSIDNSVMFEANAMNVWLLTFQSSLNLSVSGCISWTEEFRKELDAKYDEIGNDPIFKNYYSKDIFEEFLSTLPDSED